MIYTNCLDQIRGHTCGYRRALSVTPVGPCISKVRHDCRHTFGRGASTGVRKRQQLDQVLGDRWTRRLNNKNLAASDRFTQRYGNLAIGKSLDLASPRLDAKLAYNVRRQLLVRSPAKYDKVF